MKTIYKCEFPNGEKYWYGDKILRRIVLIISIVEFALIIYLLLR